MTEKHLSTQFDAELSGIRPACSKWAWPAEAQVAQAVYALTNFSNETADQVLQQEERVNAMEVEIDRDLSTIIARRQPTGGRPAAAGSRSPRRSPTTWSASATRRRASRAGVQRLINTGVSSRLRLPVADVAFEARPRHRPVAQGARRVRPARRRRRRSRSCARTTRSTRSSRA